MTARIAYQMNVSLDGYVAAPDGSLDWGTVDEEIHDWWNELVRRAAAFVYGRRLYETMAGYWPTALDDPDATPSMLEFARIWNPKPKIVFSSTLTSAAPNARVIQGDVVERFADLRAEFDGELQVGGPELAAQLIERDMVDEYGLLVHPVAIGGGKPFFPPGVGVRDLRLINTHAFENGCVYLGYGRR